MNEITINYNRKLWPLYLLFFTSTDTVLFGTNSNDMFLYVPRIVGILLILYPIIISRGKILYNKGALISASILCFILAGNFLFNATDMLTIISRIISIFVAYTISIGYNYKTYIKVFDKSMVIISIAALIIEMLSYVLPSVIMALPQVINTAEGAFATCLVGGIQINNLGNQLIRSSGIFWEPGAFAIYLSIALLFQLFYLNTNIKKVILYGICLFTTFSTTGYITFFIMIIVFLCTTKNNRISKRMKNISIGIIIMIALLIMFAENTELYNVLFGKIINRESTSVTRYASIVNGLEIGFDYPLLGVGPNNMSEYMATYAQKSNFDFGANPWNTNTTTYQFAAYGFIFGVIFVIGNYKFFAKTNQKKLLHMGLFLVLMIAYCGEVFFSFMPYVFMFYGLKSGNYERNCDENSSY